MKRDVIEPNVLECANDIVPNMVVVLDSGIFVNICKRKKTLQPFIDSGRPVRVVVLESDEIE